MTCLAAKCNFKDVPMFSSWVNIDPKYVYELQASTIQLVIQIQAAIYHN